MSQGTFWQPPVAQRPMLWCGDSATRDESQVCCSLPPAPIEASSQSDDQRRQEGPTGCWGEMRSPPRERLADTGEKGSKWRNWHTEPERGHSGLNPDVPTWKQLLPQGRGAGQRLPKCPGQPPSCPSLSPCFMVPSMHSPACISCSPQTWPLQPRPSDIKADTKAGT